MVSSRSMPVQNARSPAAVSTIARTSSLYLKARQTNLSSSRIFWLNAFSASGRFNVIHATPSSSS
jgi:hypothetical protein